MDPDRLRVLLVEDDPDHAALVEALLADVHDPPAEVVQAGTLAEARVRLAAAQTGGPPVDVVLCDQRLPDSGHRETVGHVVAAAAGVPVVALTSIGDMDVALHAMREGAEDYLVKSDLSPELLRRTLRYAVEQARHSRELRATNEALRRTVEHGRQMQAQIVEQEKLAGLGGLLSGVAHELRNPLHLAVGYAEAADQRAGELAALLGGALGDEAGGALAELQENVRKVAEHGRRADGVLLSLFEHARGVVGKLQPVDLHAALDAALTRAVPDGVRVERDYADDLSGPSVIAVGGALSRALFNVAENAAIAVAASGAAGVVRATTRLEEAPSEGVAVVLVEDDGAGVPDEALPHVFEPFYTAWGPGRRVGLGLTLAHSVVASHGGHIEVGPSPLGGAAVRIRLPRRPLALDVEGAAPQAPPRLEP